MNILVLADQEYPPLWNPLHPYRHKDVDLILSCGDLSPDYLSFIATYSHAPVLYVHGNHDEQYNTRPPLGCICIDDRIYRYRGVRILGLGGSVRYTPAYMVHGHTHLNYGRQYPRQSQFAQTTIINAYEYHVITL